MSLYIYRHCAGSHTLKVVGTQVTLDGQTFTAPASFSPRVSLSGRVALVAQEPGELNGVPYNGGAVLVYADGELRVAYTIDDPKGATRGRCPIAWGPDDRLYVLLGKNAADTAWILTIATDGTERELSTGRYASEGLWKVTDRIYFGNENTHRVVNGRNLWNWDEDAHGNLAGKSDIGPHGCVAFTKDQGQSWQIWEAPADLQETIYVSGTNVAATGFDTPEPDQMPWSPLPIIVTPPVVDCSAAEARAKQAEQQRDALQSALTQELREVRRLEKAASDAQSELTTCNSQLATSATEVMRLKQIETKYNRIPGWLRRAF